MYFNSRVQTDFKNIFYKQNLLYRAKISFEIVFYNSKCLITRSVFIDQLMRYWKKNWLYICETYWKKICTNELNFRNSIFVMISSRKRFSRIIRRFSIFFFDVERFFFVDNFVFVVFFLFVVFVFYLICWLQRQKFLISYRQNFDIFSCNQTS